MHEILRELVGDVVYRKSIDDLSGDFLSGYETIKLYVELTSQERREYDTESDYSAEIGENS